MTDQLSLECFERTHARASDPVTSADAAGRAARFATKHADMVLNVLRMHGELTPHEIASFVPLDSVQTTRRLSDLLASGLAEPTGATRQTPSGARARVWRAI